MSLSLAEIKRAKVQSFRDVADALDGMAGANRDMKRGVERLPIMGEGWKGVSGDAAHHDIDMHGKYLDAHAQAQQGAAGKIRRAADEFEGVQQLLKKIESDAAQGKFTINDETGEVTPPNGKYDKNELDYLTNTLRQIRAAGDAANSDLEAAVKAAQTLPDPSGATGALPAVPGSATKPDGSFGALQNLATARPDGQPAETRSAAASADTQANYKEWYPKAPATGDKVTIDPSKAGSFAGTVGALDKLPGTPKPPDGFGTGVARQFGQGVNQAIDGMIDEAKSKVGLNGADKFKEAWVGTAKSVENEMVNQLFPGVGMAQEAKGMIDQGVTSYEHPETIPKNIGAGLAQAGAVAATGPLAGEAAAGARGLIGDASIAGRGGLLDTPGLTHDAPQAPVHAPVETPSAHPGHVVDHPAPVADNPAPGDHLTPHTPAADGWSGHSALDSSGQLTNEVRDHILSFEKGSRPDPSEYLPREYIDHHLAPFNDGASRFMPESNLDKYGIAQRDGTSFVMPKGEADSLIGSTHGNPRLMEQALGLPEGYLDSNKLVRVDIPNPGNYELRMPSGNEAGANEQWIPGGKLPDGASEAIIDGGRVPNGGYNVTEIPNGGGHR
ncbi:endonuclease [Mycobacteroides chelonae]|uniref:endonuclease n=1 Tax=Mycobacteroides chelonae TaxID=1774 RepID=UPI000B2ADDE5|nr:endonuclease [Mycobacteroides chelonae]